ncbi:hypothetical protein TNCV_129161 [Trichonephila clavipes]|nr:hypothetical protein TNCV_129161 [Trichonephila clavipes]
MSDIHLLASGEATQMEACHEKFHGIKRPTGRWMYKLLWGSNQKEGRNERKEKGECFSYPRSSSTMDDPREELVKGNGNFCRGARYLEGL